MSTIIFDFDGTIADTFDLIVDVSYELTSMPRLPAQQIEKLRSLPILTALRRLGRKPWHIPKLMLLTRRRMQPRMGTVPIFPGITQLLKQLQASGHTLLILSSNTTANVDVFLQTNELAGYFESIYTVPYGNTWFKARALQKIARRLNLNKRTSYYVGNEALDVQAANEVGMHSVAVTWSGQNEADLAAAKPDVVVHKPTELSNIFATIEA